MPTSPKKLLILSSGGDAPGMNAAIRAAVRLGLAKGMAIHGCMGGYQGLLEHRIIPMDNRSVANCIQTGGTLLKSGRCLDFHQASVRQEAADFLTQQGFDALLVLGGNGSFQGAQALSRASGIATLGIPCTIDNDIEGTDYCIGFDTACNTALQAIDKIRDTALSHDRHFMIEVMGRDSGALAVDVGIAGGAEIILTPEVPLDMPQLIQTLKQQHQRKMASIMLVAEAGEPGRSIALAQHIKKEAGLDYKVCILGHTQRGGTPSMKDRLTASLMGAYAIEALMEGQSQAMVSVTRGAYAITPFPNSEHSAKAFAGQKLLALNALLCDIDTNQKSDSRSS
jgi:6-phosphofructokinase 1